MGLLYGMHHVNIILNPRPAMRFRFTRTTIEGGGHLDPTLKNCFFVTEKPPIQLLLIDTVRIGFKLLYNIKNVNIWSFGSAL